MGGLEFHVIRITDKLMEIVFMENDQRDACMLIVLVR